MIDSPTAAVADRIPLPKDTWYVGAASTQLADTPLSVVIHGEPIVLFRDADGRAMAVHDRCPHRGVALSLGTVVEGMIACAYHGWRFDGAGRCRHIPSLHPDQPIKAAPIRSYPVAERDGYVWLWTGSGEPEGDPLPIEGFDRYGWLQGAVPLACEAMLPIENNLDICHAAFTHPRMHPQWFRVQAAGFLPTRYELATDFGGLTVTAPGTRLRFDLPDRVTVGSGDAFRLVLHHVPTTPGRCLQHWLLQREAITNPTAPIWSDKEPEILAQDRRVIESAQLAYAREGDAFEQSVEADATTLAARRVIRIASSGRRETAARSTKDVFVLS